MVMVKSVFIHDLTLTYVVVVFLLAISLQSPYLTHDVPLSWILLLIYERSQRSQWPQDVHALIISRYKAEMIKPPLLRQAPLWSPHLLHWVLQLVPGPVWQSLHFVTHLKDNQYAINECAILNSWPYVIIFKFRTTIAWINNQYATNQ